MKTSVILAIVVLLALGISSCSSDTADDNLQNSEASVQAITNLAVSGTWFISSFVDSGTDETNNFDGYGFTFNSDGSKRRMVWRPLQAPGLLPLMTVVMTAMITTAVMILILTYSFLHPQILLSYRRIGILYPVRLHV